jgi:hypothetical protein
VPGWRRRATGVGRAATCGVFAVEDAGGDVAFQFGRVGGGFIVGWMVG